MKEPFEMPVKPLTRRERDVLALLSERLSDREIAGRLTLSLASVKWYTRQIYDKIAVKNRYEAAEYARQYFGENNGPRPAANAALASALTAIPEDRLRHNLPSGWLRLIGREPELAQIEEHLRNPACRLLSLVGPGGSGKTHLALEAAYRLLEGYAHGVCFVALAGLHSAEGIPAAIAQALGLPLIHSSDPFRELVGYLKQREVLLLLDNCEHLPDGASIFAKILQDAPRIRLLVTTRTRLSLRDEYLLPVNGLAYPQKREALQPANAGEPTSAGYASVELFLESARRFRPGFQPDPDETTLIGQICQRVQGLPLAVLLAATWIDALTPASILREIETHSLEFLETNYSDVPERHQSLRAVFDGSYRLLTRREAEIFTGLSVFRGSFSLESAQAVTAASLRHLRGLVEKNLLQRDAAGRYTLHELLRQYAGERLDQDPALRETIHENHCAWFATALEDWWNDMRSEKQIIAMQAMGLEVENILLASDWMVNHVQIDRMRNVLIPLTNFVYIVYGETRGIEILTKISMATEQKLAALALPAPTTCPEAARLLARIWINWPSLNFQFPETNQRYLLQSEILLQRLETAGVDVRLEKAMLFKQFGSEAAEAGKADEMRRWWGQSLALYHALGDTWCEAGILKVWGWVAGQLGEQAEGLRMLHQCITLYHKMGDHLQVSRSLLNMRELLWVTLDGDFDPYEPLVREYVAFCAQAGNAMYIARSKGEFGAFFLRQGKFTEGIDALVESVTAFHSLGDLADENFYGLFLSETELHLGGFQGALTRCQESLKTYRENNQRALVGYNLLLLGWAALGLGQYTQAAQYLREVNIAETQLRMNERALGFAAQAFAERALGSPLRAASLLVQALQIAVERRLEPIFYYALPAAALLLADRGQVEWAVEVYALAGRYRYVANSRMLDEVAGQEIAARAAELPPEVTAAARARGQIAGAVQTGERLLAEFSLV